MKRIFISIILILFHTVTFAQTGRDVKGIVKDSLGNSVIAAGVKLVSAKDTLTTRTDMDGNFMIKNVKSSTFLISIMSLGYKSLHKRYLFNEGTTSLALPPIVLSIQAKQLHEVVISGTPPITVKEDTLEYRTKDYKLKNDAVAEDLLKKLPGVSVDQAGNVTTQGQAVTRVRINGKDYFGGDVKTATQNLPANVIDHVTIVDDYGDQANITGIKTGDPIKVLDIHIRPDKNKGYVGKGTFGKGTDGRYQASVAVNYLNNTQQISFLGNFNNTNTSSFNLGGGNNSPRIQPNSSTGSSGSSSFGSGNNSSGSGSNGITTLSSIGLNYRDDWSKKISSYGSYSYANSSNDLVNSSVQQNNYQGTLILNTQKMNSNLITGNHRLNWNLEYKIDSLNYLKVSPMFTYTKSSTQASGSSILENNGIQLPPITNSSQAETETPSLGGNILFNHRFLKRGRNVSLNITANSSNNSQDQDITTSSTVSYQRQTQHIGSKTPNYTTNLSYIEPLNTTSMLEFNYVHYYALYDNNRATNDISPSGLITPNNTLSNNYNYSFTTDRVGINYRVNQKRYNYYIGAGIQPTVLTGESGPLLNTRDVGFEIIPSARFSYNFSKTRSFNVGVFGKSVEPTFAQLQPNIDQSNPQFPIQGNPNLRAQFNQMLRLKYNNFNFNTGDVLYTTLSAMYTKNKIVTNTVKYTSTNNSVTQQTNYLNTDGYYTITGFYLWSKPFAEKKYVLSFNGSANYNNNISYSDSQKNTGHNWVLGQGFNAQINPQEWLEMNPGVSYNYNINTNDLLTQTNTRVSTWTFSFNSKTYLLKTWLIGTDMSKAINNGYNTVELNPLIINLYLEKQFFKGNTGALRLQGYDLFNQNANVSRSVTANSITDSRNNQLGRYFMLSFTLRLQNFNGINAQNILTPSGQPKNQEGSPFR